MLLGVYAKAQKRAKRLYPNSIHFQNAYLAGVRAAQSGKPPDDCPYWKDSQSTWRRAWRKAWLRGHASMIE